MRRVKTNEEHNKKGSPEVNCEGDAANEATIIDYSKTGANKR